MRKGEEIKIIGAFSALGASLAVVCYLLAKTRKELRRARVFADMDEYLLYHDPDHHRSP